MSWCRLLCQSKQKRQNSIKERLLTKERQRNAVDDPTSWCKLLAAHGLEEIPKRQSLLRDTNKLN